MFAPNQYVRVQEAAYGAMAAILFTCPTTQFKIQHWLDDNERASEDEYEGITCPGCARVHFVNRKGRVLGSEEE